MRFGYCVSGVLSGSAEPEGYFSLAELNFTTCKARVRRDAVVQCSRIPPTQTQCVLGDRLSRAMSPLFTVFGLTYTKGCVYGQNLVRIFYEASTPSYNQAVIVTPTAQERYPPIIKPFVIFFSLLLFLYTLFLYIAHANLA